jgi:hypothetical protein
LICLDGKILYKEMAHVSNDNNSMPTIPEVRGAAEGFSATTDGVAVGLGASTMFWPITGVGGTVEGSELGSAEGPEEGSKEGS